MVVVEWWIDCTDIKCNGNAEGKRSSLAVASDNITYPL